LPGLRNESNGFNTGKKALLPSLEREQASLSAVQQSLNKQFSDDSVYSSIYEDAGMQDCNKNK
jgi:hypothetical protein